jgi:hypothetical protein
MLIVMLNGVKHPLGLGDASSQNHQNDKMSRTQRSIPRSSFFCLAFLVYIRNIVRP